MKPGRQHFLIKHQNKGYVYKTLIPCRSEPIKQSNVNL